MGAAAAVAVGIAGRLAWQGARLAPLVVLAVAGVALIVAAALLARRGVLLAPLLRERGVNLEATRGVERPVVWLCAHLDSKSQPVTTLVRTMGLVLEGAGFLAALSLALVVALGAVQPRVAWVLAALATLVGAVPVVMSVVGQRSPGAFDNASGVATVFEAARALSDRDDVGVLITDAEELGLAGARAWAADLGGGTVLNCDGVDDHGGILVMFSGARPRGLFAAIGRASVASGVSHRASRLIPGILTDSVAFSQAGLDSVTFSRGSVRSLARVHSSRDGLANLAGTGIAQTAMLMAATVRELGDPR